MQLLVQDTKIFMDQRKANQVTAQTKWFAVMGVAIVVIVALYFLTSLFKSSGSASKYSASILKVSQVNPSTVSVQLKVTNNGSKSGSPLCTVEVGNRNAGYTGNNEFVMNDNPAPGKSVTATQQVTVSNQGAAKVTQGSISCS
jgi:Domain of unknown function (DUF4307)